MKQVVGKPVNIKVLICEPGLSGKGGKHQLLVASHQLYNGLINMIEVPIPIDPMSSEYLQRQF